MLLSNPHDNVFTETQCLSYELIARDNFHILSIATCRKKKSKQIRCDSFESIQWIDVTHTDVSRVLLNSILGSKIEHSMSVVNILRETFQLSSQCFCHSFSCSLKSARWQGSSQNTTSLSCSHWLISGNYSMGTVLRHFLILVEEQHSMLVRYIRTNSTF